MRLALRMANACNKDHALHQNDARSALSEVLEYDRAITEVVLPLAGDQALVVGASDHGTGGLSLGQSFISPSPREAVVGYAWYPSVLVGQDGSIHEQLFGLEFWDPIKHLSIDDLLQKVKDRIKEKVKLPGDRGHPVLIGDELRKKFMDPNKWEEKDFKDVESSLRYFIANECEKLGVSEDDCIGGVVKSKMLQDDVYSDADAFKVAVGRLIANKAGLSFGTRGHTSTDINLYCNTPRDRHSSVCKGTCSTTRLASACVLLLACPASRNCSSLMRQFRL
mmetsp:Transcript_163145/g.518341  ORF Transcript_163145/g.518341 Transcript_163145/m.518341 type:complete len:279 (-) Transcript_163145:220-1056(-)